MGYLNKPDDTAQAITADGWLRSGDIGHVGDGGFLFVSDRVKDMIITGAAVRPLTRGRADRCIWHRTPVSEFCRYEVRRGSQAPCRQG